TVQQQARAIRGKQKEKYHSIEAVEKKEFYPMSSAQKRLYILQQMEEGNINYNMPLTLLLEGALEREHLEKTFVKLIKRHESFRTSFIIKTGKQEPVQRIHEEVDFAVEYHETAHSTDIVNKFVRPFDLAAAPLIRVGLIKNQPLEHILTIDIHHIVSDGVSMGNLIRDFMALYNTEDLKPLPLQYKDFAEWQNRHVTGAEMTRRQHYWKKQFDEEPPVLELPTDYPRPLRQIFDGGSLQFKIGAEEKNALKTQALKEGVTLFMQMMALYTVTLSRLSNQEDIVV
ncbi:MAG: non-ribosomal peptide synthetase, partial [bacterium]|nr:non-ribosomal peptide synthetase [bacterium]